MKSLRDLIGMEVDVTVPNYEPDEMDASVRCKVMNVIIDDYYFHEKNEPIYISVNAIPLDLESLPDWFEKDDFDYFSNIPIENILK